MIVLFSQESSYRVFQSVEMLMYWQSISDFEGHDFYGICSLIASLGGVVIHSSHAQLDTDLDPLIDVLLWWDQLITTYRYLQFRLATKTIGYRMKYSVTAASAASKASPSTRRG